MRISGLMGYKKGINSAGLGQRMGTEVSESTGWEGETGVI